MSTKRISLALVLILFLGALPKLISFARGASDLSTAKERIETAIQKGLTVLDFSDLAYLPRIPEGIKNVKELWYLNAISATRLTDIQSLEGLPDLRHLQIGATRIADLSVLSSLTQLEVLDIRNTWVSDLEPISGLPNLHWLQMNELGVSSLCPLTKIRSLDWLNLHKSYAKDGSQDCFVELQNRITDLGGGASYKQGYIPGDSYLWKVSIKRFLQQIEWL